MLPYTTFDYNSDLNPADSAILFASFNLPAQLEIKRVFIIISPRIIVFILLTPHFPIYRFN